MAQEELYLGHKDIMNENNLQQSDLPENINNKIIALNLRIADYQANPTATEQQSIETASAKLAHEIYDWVEKDLPDEPEGGAPAPPATPPTPPAGGNNNNPNNTEKRSKGGIFDWLF